MVALETGDDWPAASGGLNRCGRVRREEDLITGRDSPTDAVGAATSGLDADGGSSMACVKQGLVVSSGRGFGAALTAKIAVALAVCLGVRVLVAQAPASG